MNENRLQLSLRIIAIVLMFCFIGCSSQNIELSDSQKAQIKQEVLQAFDQLVDASKSLDTMEYFKLFDADKFIGLDAYGNNWNSLGDLKKVIEPGFHSIEKIVALEFTNLRVSVIDFNNAILVNEYEQELLLKNGSEIKVSGGGTQVWSRSGGEWRLVSVSASNKADN